MSDEYAIESLNLTKKFGDFVAVNSVSFKVKRGQIFGMLGPNGSGKSTTIRMLCGILDPTSGTAKVAGVDVRENPELVKANIGYMSQRFSLYTDLTAEENLRFYAGVYGVPKEERDQRIAQTIEMAGLRGKERVLTGELSTGIRQRLALGSAIIHQPKIIFLDEPTSGADPVSRRRFWDLIYDLTAHGATVMLTTHYMDEAERCDTVLLISRGSVIALGTPAELKREKVQGKILSVETDQPTEALDIVSAIPGVQDVALYGRSIHAVTSDPDALTRLAREQLGRRNVEVREISEVTPTLEDVFVSLIGGQEFERGQVE